MKSCRIRVFHVISVAIGGEDPSHEDQHQYDAGRLSFIDDRVMREDGIFSDVGDRETYPDAHGDAGFDHRSWPRE